MLDFQNKALLNCDLSSYWIDDAGKAVTRNLGSLSGTVQLGDGVTPATFPTQVFPHGMSFDGASDYLLASDATDLMAFPSPAAFSFETLLRRQADPAAFGVYAVAAKMGTTVPGDFTTPWALYTYNDGAGAISIWWGSTSAVGLLRGVQGTVLATNVWPRNVVCHIVALYDGTTWRLYVNGQQVVGNITDGCYPVVTPAQSMYVGRWPLYAAYAAMSVYNWAVYPFALQPGEVASLCRTRLATLNRGF